MTPRSSVNLNNKSYMSQIVFFIVFEKYLLLIVWQMENKEDDPVVQYAEEPESFHNEAEEDQEEEKMATPQNPKVKLAFRPTEEQAAASHKFWDTQPVPKLS